MFNLTILNLLFFLVLTVEANGKQDFSNDVIQVTFPATTAVDQMEQAVTIYFRNDDINEATEGFYLHATIDTAASNAMDVQQASPVRSGVTLININDDDSELIGILTHQ